MGRAREGSEVTYMSLNVRLYPQDVTAAKLEGYAAVSELFRGLSPHARAVGPDRLAAWAAATDLPVHYVDNAWVRVPVSPEQLALFYAQVLGTPKLSIHPPADRLLVIEAEEF